jgi:lactoylglutathione lyase
MFPQDAVSPFALGLLVNIMTFICSYLSVFSKSCYHELSLYTSSGELSTGGRMRIEHVALWCRDLERLRAFYERYFDAVSNDKYVNEAKGFESCFLSFDSGARLELMYMGSIPETGNDPPAQYIGIVHIAISVGGKEKVDELTHELREGGHTIISGPRITGDGYYESVVLDPEKNRIEISE